MTHAPHEDTRTDEARENKTPAEDAPGRTPHSAEGTDGERKLPGGEPGKTPGSAEGDEPSATPPRSIH